MDANTSAVIMDTSTQQLLFILVGMVIGVIVPVGTYYFKAWWTKAKPLAKFGVDDTKLMNSFDALMKKAGDAGISYSAKKIKESDFKINIIEQYFSKEDIAKYGDQIQKKIDELVDSKFKEKAPEAPVVPEEPVQPKEPVTPVEEPKKEESK